MTSGISGPATVAYASRDVISGHSDINVLRAFAIAAGICWSVLFVVIGLRYELQMYADGSIFSYAIAVRDAWAFHWHNISGRLFVYLFCHLPAETYVELAGDPYGGIVVYGFLFFVAPLLGLTATFAADRSRGRIIFSYACLSTGRRAGGIPARPVHRGCPSRGCAARLRRHHPGRPLGPAFADHARELRDRVLRCSAARPQRRPVSALQQSSL
jgi:hypothetical protein